MAEIGQQLNKPETGWKRFEQNDSLIEYFGTWSINDSFSMSGGSHTISSKSGSGLKLYFKGTKIRILSFCYDGYSNKVEININGVIEEFTTSYSGRFKALVYEKTGLPNQVHEVTITNRTSKIFSLDAIDIDDIGELKPKPVTATFLKSNEKIFAYNENGELLELQDVSKEVFKKYGMEKIPAWDLIMSSKKKIIPKESFEGIGLSIQISRKPLSIKFE